MMHMGAIAKWQPKVNCGGVTGDGIPYLSKTSAYWFCFDIQSLCLACTVFFSCDSLHLDFFLVVSPSLTPFPSLLSEPNCPCDVYNR